MCGFHDIGFKGLYLQILQTILRIANRGCQQRYKTDKNDTNSTKWIPLVQNGQRRNMLLLFLVNCLLLTHWHHVSVVRRFVQWTSISPNQTLTIMKTEPKRICIYVRDVQIVTGKSYRASHRLLDSYKVRLRKKRGEFVTVREFSEMTGIAMDDLVTMIRD